MGLRGSDFAGSWYPGRETDCRDAIKGLSQTCVACPEEPKTGVGGIVPHAGWYYSGQIACNVIKCLAQDNKPDTCLIFGRHLHPGSRNYIMKEGQWDTPLGELELDSEVAEKLVEDFPFTVETSSSYEPDNTIELQLPFIKYFFPATKIVPIGLPPKMDSIKIAKRAAQISLELGRKTIVLGSTDLTHYGYNYGYVPKGTGEAAVDWVKQKNDRRVVDLMLDMDEKAVIAEAIENQNACCSGAAGAAIAAAKVLEGKKAKKIKYLTSYDIRPDNSFVGYVGIVFYPL